VSVNWHRFAGFGRVPGSGRREGRRAVRARRSPPLPISIRVGKDVSLARQRVQFWELMICPLRSCSVPAHALAWNAVVEACHRHGCSVTTMSSGKSLSSADDPPGHVGNALALSTWPQAEALTVPPGIVRHCVTKRNTMEAGTALPCHSYDRRRQPHGARFRLDDAAVRSVMRQPMRPPKLTPPSRPTIPSSTHAGCPLVALSVVSAPAVASRLRHKWAGSPQRHAETGSSAPAFASRMRG
jgi:hypothetical protein